jgi:deoxyribodipyrimidine photo-lyase
VTTAVVLFTRDLRVHDNPALRLAAERCDAVVPLFVVDDQLVRLDGRAANRWAFLLESLDDLRGSLRRLGGELVVRRGDPVRETVGVALAAGARHVLVAEDASPLADRRLERLGQACGAEGLELQVTPGTAVVPPGDVAPAGRDHFLVFTPYHRRWAAAPVRAVVPPPPALRLPPVAGLEPGTIPELGTVTRATPSPGRQAGGERAGRNRLDRWLAHGLDGYAAGRDDLSADATSRLSAYLHFGCVSAVEVVTRARQRPGSDAFVRQLAWRDFFLQVLDARPETARDDLHPGRRRWRRTPGALDAWRDGRTGYPLVDAGMRQLREEGFVHNRVRLVVASFLTKTLGVDWRHGARHFADLLTDGDVASNVGSWQWVAGTGTDTRPGRIFNPVRQGRRLDPSGAYVRRYVPELRGVEGGAVHEPWRLGLLAPEAYAERIVVHEDAAAALRAQTP